MNSALHILKIRGQNPTQSKVQIRDWKFDLLLDIPLKKATENQHFLALQADYPKLGGEFDAIPFHCMTRIPL